MPINWVTNYFWPVVNQSDTPQGMPPPWSGGHSGHNRTILSHHCLWKRLLLLRDCPLVHHVTIVATTSHIEMV